MLLQCEMEADGAPDLLAPAWLLPEMLASLREVNEECLALLAEQAGGRATEASPLLRQFDALWGGLDRAARRRAASCPYLLLDAGFAEPRRWLGASATQVGDAEAAYRGGFFTVPAAREVARLVFTFAWHLARSAGPAAHLLLGLPPPSAVNIGQYTLPQIQALGESHPQWLRPRWPARVQVWRELLLAAAAGEGRALERARLRGMPLLAAESRLALPRSACV
jgi:hypothetical protein